MYCTLNQIKFIMKYLCIICFSFFCFSPKAQKIYTDSIYVSSIKTVQLYQQNNQQSLPIIKTNNTGFLELHFDDMDAYVKNYFYTYQLCNENWEEVNLSPFDYIKGFTQNRLTQYRVSSITQTPYVHYQAILPERGSVPTRTGNYILKVFANGDVNNIVFTKRMFVTDNTAIIGVQVLQPFDSKKFLTHQRVQVSVNVAQLNPINPQQQVKVVILQNNRWDNAVRNIMPAFIRGNILEYNGEQDCLFPAGKEYRWADLRSFRLESERVAKIEKNEFPNIITLKPDVQRNKLRYTFFRDLNGWYDISSLENINPFWQADYGYVKFTFAPGKDEDFSNKDVYISGNLTNNIVADTAKMEYIEQDGVFEKTLFLKMGFYSYTYLTKDKNSKQNIGDVTLTEGNFWETENEYTVLVYFRSLQGRHDELVGVATINSRR